MKKLMILMALLFGLQTAYGTIHEIKVWNGYYQYLPSSLTIQLGDTIQWLPLDPPTMSHTITSSNIPAGAASFDVIWQLPADTFFQYVPTVAGVYDYVCTPHVSFGMTGSFTVDGGNSITASTSQDELIIFPNPVVNVLHLRTTANYTQYQLYDLGGKVVQSGKPNLAIRVHQLPHGTYVLRLMGDKPRSVVIQKQ